MTGYDIVSLVTVLAMSAFGRSQPNADSPDTTTLRTVSWLLQTSALRPWHLNIAVVT